MEVEEEEEEEEVCSHLVALGDDCFDTLVMTLATIDAPLHFLSLPDLASLAQSSHPRRPTPHLFETILPLYKR